MNTEVICSYPRIILHPLALRLIAQYGNYYIRGSRSNVVRPQGIYFKDKIKGLNAKKLKITKNDLEDCYIVDDRTGERFDLFMSVPCGRCANCKATKTNSLVHRCKLESMMYDSEPIFITLTYDNEHCPP